MLEEMIFIPFDKGFEQMRSGLEELAYMNSNNEAYLMLEDCVYKIDVSLGRMEKVWDNLNSSNCTASDKAHRFEYRQRADDQRQRSVDHTFGLCRRRSGIRTD